MPQSLESLGIEVRVHDAPIKRDFKTVLRETVQFSRDMNDTLSTLGRAIERIAKGLPGILDATSISFKVINVTVKSISFALRGLVRDGRAFSLVTARGLREFRATVREIREGNIQDAFRGGRARIRRAGPDAEFDIRRTDGLSERALARRGLGAAAPYLDDVRYLNEGGLGANAIYRNIVKINRLDLNLTDDLKDSLRSIIRLNKELTGMRELVYNASGSFHAFRAALVDSRIATDRFVYRSLQPFLNRVGIDGVRTLQVFGTTMRHQVTSGFGLAARALNPFRNGLVSVVDRLSISSLAIFSWSGQAVNAFRSVGNAVRRLVQAIRYGLAFLPAVFLTSTAALSSFQSAENKLAASTGLNLRYIRKQYSGLAEEIATETGIAAEKILVTIGRGISNDLSGPELRAAVLSAANLDALGGGEAFDIIDAATTITSAYADSALDAAAAIDALAKTGQKGSGEMLAFSNALRPNVNLGAQLGVEFSELAASLSVLSKTVQVSDAGTQVQGFLRAIIRPTKQAEAALESIGVKFSELRGILAGPDGLPRLVAFLNTLPENVITGVFGNITGLLAALTLESSEILRISEEIRNSQGEVHRLAEETARTLPRIYARAYETIKESLRAASRDFLDSLPIGKLDEYLATISGIVRELGRFAAFVAEIVLKNIGLVQLYAAFSLIYLIMKPLVISLAAGVIAFKVLGFLLPKISLVLGFFGKAAALAAVKVVALNVAVILLPVLVTGLIASIAAFIVWLNSGSASAERFKDAVSESLRNLGVQFKRFVHVLFGDTDVIVRPFRTAYQKYRQLWGLFFQGWRNIGNFVQNIWNNDIGGFIVDWLKFLVRRWGETWGRIIVFFKSVPLELSLGWNRFVEHILSSIKRMSDSFSAFVSGTFGFFGVDSTFKIETPDLDKAISDYTKKTADLTRELETYHKGQESVITAAGDAAVALAGAAVDFGKAFGRALGGIADSPLGSTGSGLFDDGGLGRHVNEAAVLERQVQDTVNKSRADIAKAVADLRGGTLAVQPEMQLTNLGRNVARSFSEAAKQAFRDQDFPGFFRRLARSISDAIIGSFTDRIGLSIATKLGLTAVSDGTPTLHSGGVYRAPFGKSEGYALLKSGEVVYNPNQGGQFGADGLSQLGGNVTVEQNMIVGDLDGYVGDSNRRNAAAYGLTQYEALRQMGVL